MKQVLRPGAPTRFRRIEQLRSHEYVAEQIRRHIMLRLVPAGQALPPERELAKLFGVGRATIQQAVNLLEKDKLIQSRRGRGGGNFIVGPTGGDGGSRRLLAKLRRDRDLILEVLSFRLELEPAVTERAAVARTSRDVIRIIGAAARVTTAVADAQFLKADTEFHMAIGDATQNRFFAEAIERIRVILNDALLALPESDLWRERTHLEHGQICSAIEVQDGRAARRASLAHVHHTELSIRALLAAL
jgi:DNA-binding FadR family transcriptional regulator